MPKSKRKKAGKLGLGASVMVVIMMMIIMTHDKDYK